MAWIVCSDCYNEFPLARMEQYVQHKLTRCHALVSSVSDEPGFHCGYCIATFNTSLALLLHVSKHDVKVSLAERMSRSKNHCRPTHPHEDTSCDCESDTVSDLGDYEDEEEAKACCSHLKSVDAVAFEHQDGGSITGAMTSGPSTTKHLIEASRRNSCSALTSSHVVGSSANNTVGVHQPSESVVDGLNPIASEHIDLCATTGGNSAAASASAAKANSVAHSSSSSSHHHVKRHACAQTACTAFEQKSHCCCVDINGQVMRLVSLGIIKLPDCCEPPIAAPRPHHHCSTHVEHHGHTHPHSHGHVHSHDRADAGQKRLSNQEDGTQTHLEASAAESLSEAVPNGSHQSPVSAASAVKLECSSPCGCASGHCERCSRRDRTDGECQTEFEWVDLDVDFDVDALLDSAAARAPLNSADLVSLSRNRSRVEALGVAIDKQFELPQVSNSQQVDATRMQAEHQQMNALNVAPFPIAVPASYPRAMTNAAANVYSNGASIESLSLATGQGEFARRAGRFSGQSAATAANTVARPQPMMMSRDAGLLFGQSSGYEFASGSQNQTQLAGTIGAQASQHGKVFQCEQCGREFKQAIHLRKHNWSLHSNDGKPYKCPLNGTGECSYSSVEKTHLQAHIRTHTGEKPYKCKYCDYAGKQSSTLRSHMLHKHPQEMLNERQLASLSPKHY